MTHLAISLLGPFQVTLNGEAVTYFASDTARALLAYLAVHPGVEHRRDALAGLLWPEQPDAEALRNLRVALSRLRDAIGDREADAPFLQVTRRTIQLTGDARCSLDVRAMREALAATRNHEHAQLEGCGTCAQRLGEVADLYRGEFLAGFTLDSVPFEEWMVVEREGLHWQALEALHALASYHEGQGNYQGAIECARRQVELEPWREVAHRQWMRALSLSGHRAAALAQYETCRRVLDQELGVEPEVETVTLYQRIRGGALQPPVAERAPALPASGDVGPAEDELPSVPIVTPSPSIAVPSSPSPTPTQIEGDRRIVTTLFAAVECVATGVGALDIEARAEAMGHTLWRVESEVVRLGGGVSQRRGDGLVATFGATTVHEDDPERAVLASLAIEEAIGCYAAEVAQGEGISLRVRMGISTGEAVVTRMGDGESQRVETMLGESASLGERLIELAKSGGVRVAAQTYALVAPLFEWQALREQGIAVYRPLAQRSGVGKGRGIEGLSSPLVGRETEFRALRGTIERLRSGSGGITTVVGEAGLGKSRLVAEVRAWAADVEWVEGCCLSYGSTVAYLPWLDMLRGLVGAAADAALVEVREMLRERVRALCGNCTLLVYPYLGRLLSLSLEEEAEVRLRGLDAEALRMLTFRAVETLIEHAARQQPLVVVCEDLHWADPTSLALLEHVLALTDRVPVTFVCVLRPETEHGCWRIRELAARDYRHRHVDLWLDPLSPADSERLVRSLLEEEALPPALRERILGYTEGNPFYLEEVLRALIAEGAIAYAEGPGRWQAVRDVAALSIPDTLHGVLVARIDRLPQGARQVLQLAAVIGHVFAYRVLVGVAGEGGGLDERLVVLQRAQMIREQARVPELQYAFHHVLTMEAAYGSLLGRKRHALHRRVAEALERLYAGRVEEQLGLLAHHWERAGEAERAVQYLRRAGEQAEAQYAAAEAMTYYDRALALVPEADLAGQYDLLTARSRAYSRGGLGGSHAAVDLAALQRMAEALADPHRQAEVMLLRSEQAFDAGDVPAGTAAAQEAIEIARAIPDPRMEALALYCLGRDLSYLGYNDQGESDLHIERALSLARTNGFHSLEAQILRSFGIILIVRADYVSAQAALERAVYLWRKVGNPVEEGRSLNALSMTAMHQGDYPKAQRICQQGLQLCQEMGNRYDEAWACETLSRIAIGLAEYEAARAYAERSLTAMRQIRAGNGEGWVLTDLSRIHCHLGDYDVAVAYLERGLGITDKELAVEGWALAVMGYLHHRQGDDQAALEYARRALLIVGGGGRYFLPVLGCALMGLGQLDQAAEVHTRALALWENLGLATLALEPLAGLSHIALCRGDSSLALHHVERCLDYLQDPATLCDAWDPFNVYLTCVRVLRANGDSRASEVLDRAYDELQARASKIDDEGLRRSYLENVPANREIVAEYAQNHTPSFP